MADTTEIQPVTVLEAGRLRPRCGQGLSRCLSSWLVDGHLPPAPSRGLPLAGLLPDRLFYSAVVTKNRKNYVYQQEKSSKFALSHRTIGYWYWWSPSGEGADQGPG